MYHVPNERHQKLDAKVNKDIFVAYLDVAKEYEIFLHEEKKVNFN